MDSMYKSLVLVFTLSLYCASCDAVTETITISNPTDGSTISGVSIPFSGTSSLANATVHLLINTTTIAKVTADTGGNWSFTYNGLADGSYTVTAKVVDSTFATLATDSNSFTVANPHKITVTTPAQDETLTTLLPTTIQGISSVESGFVQLYMDTVFTSTVSTDANGNWQANYPALVNGPHTLFAQLVTASPLEVVADTTVTFTSSNPLIFSSGVSLIRVVQGRVPTSGSGSGLGFTYSVSGSIITLIFSPAFTSTPYVVATGQRSSGSSTVTVTSVSTTSVSVAFSTGTQQVSFQATLLQ